YKLGSWLALIFCAQSLANMRNIETDLKQISTGFIDFAYTKLKIIDVMVQLYFQLLDSKKVSIATSFI
nr:protein asterix [Tanacetum cinerariifolium]